jgi:DNA modification methylase
LTLSLPLNSSKQSVLLGDCRDVMRGMEENSVSCIVTDPPYGLSFMGKGWDHQVPGKEFWQEALRIVKPGGMLLSFGGSRTYHRLTCAIEDSGWEIRDCIMWIYGSGFPKSHNKFGFLGYGTALKPAHEPIIMAMKPLEGTFAQNAEKWGVAGLNIDGCRIGGKANSFNDNRLIKHNDVYGKMNPQNYDGSRGRWPANVILDEEAGALVGEPSRFFYCSKASSAERNKGCEDLEEKIGGGMQSTVSGDTRTGHITKQKNNHPTVKPQKLMEYLIKLVMPPKDGILLDPFCGSGSTLVAAKNLDVNAVGIEISPDYVKIIKKRICDET